MATYPGAPAISPSGSTADPSHNPVSWMRRPAVALSKRPVAVSTAAMLGER